MKNSGKITASAGRLEMLVVEFLKRAVEVHERTPVQILEFTVTKRKPNRRFKQDPDKFDVKAKFLLLYHNPGDYVPFCNDLEENLYTFDVEGTVLIDHTAGVPCLVNDKYQKVKVERDRTTDGILGNRGRLLKEDWTVMMKNKATNQSLGPVFEFCIFSRGNFSEPHYWVVGTSHSDVWRRSHHSSLPGQSLRVA